MLAGWWHGRTRLSDGGRRRRSFAPRPTCASSMWEPREGSKRVSFPSAVTSSRFSRVLPIKVVAVQLGAFEVLARAAAVLPGPRALVKAPRAARAPRSGRLRRGFLVGLAAWSARVPVAILATDVVLGLANRWLVPFAKRLTLRFPRPSRS